MSNKFHNISNKISELSGSTMAFLLAVIGIMVWLISGPYFHFSNTWLIAIATITDVVIFLMVFSIQNTQNRDSRAVQLKLNELIIADKKARDTFIGLEELTDDELSDLDEEFKQLLGRLEVHPAMHKLHKTIKQEKSKRPGLYDRAEHFVDNLLNPTTSNHDKNS